MSGWALTVLYAFHHLAPKDWPGRMEGREGVLVMNPPKTPINQASPLLFSREGNCTKITNRNQRTKMGELKAPTTNIPEDFYEPRNLKEQSKERFLGQIFLPLRSVRPLLNNPAARGAAPSNPNSSRSSLTLRWSASRFKWRLRRVSVSGVLFSGRRRKTSCFDAATPASMPATR